MPKEILVESQPSSLSTTPAKEPEQPGISLLDFGKGKFGHRIGIVGMERVLKTAFADIQEKNSPHASIVKLYQLFAAQLPSFISSESKLAALEATQSKNSDSSKAGIKVFTLLHIPVILSAAEPYLTGYSSEDQADLIQAGISNLLSGIPRFTGTDPDKITTDDSHRISNSARSLVVTGIVQEIADKKNLPVEWVRNNLHTRAAGLIDAAFISHPYGLTREQITEAVEGISQATGTSKESVASVLKDRNSLLDITKPEDAKDLVDIVLQPTMHSAIMKALDHLPDRAKTIMEARYGFLDQDFTLEEAGELIGLKGHSGGTRACQLESKAIRKLRHPSRSRPLKPYLFPEYGEIHQPKQPQPEYEFIDMQALATKYVGQEYDTVAQTKPDPVVHLVDSSLVSEIRLRYIYPLVRLNQYYGERRGRIWDGLNLDGKIVETLKRNYGILNLAQLLALSESKLQKTGFTTEMIQQIKTQVTEFLEEDAKITISRDRQKPDKTHKQKTTESAEYMAPRPRRLAIVWDDGSGNIFYLEPGTSTRQTLLQIETQKQAFQALGTDEQTRLKAEFESSNGSAESTRLYRDFLRSEMLGKQIRESINPTS